jgi:uncharacterized membrane protein YfcA
VDPAIAAGTSLSVVWITAITATYTNWHQEKIYPRAAIMIGITGVPTIALGIILVKETSPEMFQLLFGSLLIIISSYMVWRPNVGPHLLNDQSIFIPIPKLISLGMGVGILSGFFGVGGGIFVTPLLRYSFHVPIRRAGATALAALPIFGGYGALMHLLLGQVSVNLFVPAATGAFVGTRIAIMFSSRIGTPLLARALALGITVMGILFFVRSLL